MVALVSGIGCFASPAAISGATKERTLVFLGAATNDADSRIKLIVRQEVRPGPNRNIRVQVRANFEQVCADGSRIKRGASGSAPFRSSDAFRDDEYYEIEETANFVSLSYKGRLLESGSAQGWLSSRYESLGSSEPDCSTDGRLRWRAERAS